MIEVCYFVCEANEVDSRRHFFSCALLGEYDYIVKNEPKLLLYVARALGLNVSSQFHMVRYFLDSSPIFIKIKELPRVVQQFRLSGDKPFYFIVGNVDDKVYLYPVPDIKIFNNQEEERYQWLT